MKWIEYTSINYDILKRAERILDIIFPEDFKNVVLQYNGGYPVPNKFCLLGNDEVFNNLISFNENEYDNVYEILEDLEGRLRRGIIPFGEDPFGNLLCFDFLNNKSIVFWNHEIDVSSSSEVTFVADNFTEFLEMLHE
ncbi:MULTISPECIES: SMI1/KNR4 family protein [unclassified Granulicatella]|uniref:SMI1/KNR4 family protein n=1 Tax=unclassified Granulicatella TaxID=2630493 RepID=UPI001073E852|nr:MULTISPECIES: SMI1/KNR4 family protein [unclassified Granulicatella]MBF0780467.1 SMI1/KNR4 family protein [Granulicatella sp. 19428wC4_WM01]TFU95369.1 SMI1/KNR4 family protein [Granulicatella sp. WM01]